MHPNMIFQVIFLFYKKQSPKNVVIISFAYEVII